mgnify:CR=1 FL=1
MAAIADEIAEIVEPIAKSNEAASKPPPDFVDIDHLPETPYERLVGRDDELARLDAAWEGGQTNIQSLVAEGGAGASAAFPGSRQGRLLAAPPSPPGR